MHIFQLKNAIDIQSVPKSDANIREKSMLFHFCHWCLRKLKKKQKKKTAYSNTFVECEKYLSALEETQVSAREFKDSQKHKTQIISRLIGF
jgi:hypothetical protein